MSLACPSIFKLSAWTLYALSLISCAGASGSYLSEASDPMGEGLIDYPFAGETRPIGRDSGRDKFILRSTVGSTEYSIEIPDSAKDYEIAVPLADLGGGNPALRGKRTANPALTDRELKNAMPTLNTVDDRGLVEGAFGVGQLDGPKQGPSYVYGLAKVNDYYLKHEYEYALVEANNLITYYPTDAKLYKMKGTLLMKLRSLKLAEIAWTRAQELAPDDPTLQTALSNLRGRLQFEAEQAKMQAASLNQ